MKNVLIIALLLIYCLSSCDTNKSTDAENSVSTTSAVQEHHKKDSSWTLPDGTHCTSMEIEAVGQGGKKVDGVYFSRTDTVQIGTAYAIRFKRWTTPVSATSSTEILEVYEPKTGKSIRSQKCPFGGF
ncbi:hypothetical protein KBC03_02920 [Patescibacteria group bacterium]|nr:hypothetical protein [Patescibacteria group bacterium]